MLATVNGYRAGLLSLPSSSSLQYASVSAFFFSNFFFMNWSASPWEMSAKAYCGVDLLHTTILYLGGQCRN
jgi:hypothetical protein